jgi:hypothetical protein
MHTAARARARAWRRGGGGGSLAAAAAGGGGGGAPAARRRRRPRRAARGGGAGRRRRRRFDQASARRQGALVRTRARRPHDAYVVPGQRSAPELAVQGDTGGCTRTRPANHRSGEAAARSTAARAAAASALPPAACRCCCNAATRTTQTLHTNEQTTAFVTALMLTRWCIIDGGNAAPSPVGPPHFRQAAAQCL